MTDHALQPRFQRWPKLLYRWPTFVLVLVGWVFVRAESLPTAMNWLGKMVGIGATAQRDVPQPLRALCVLCFVVVNIRPET
ncbi:hypothetical protein [Deinococcus hohokamensis]|uniref:Transposase n=1 Tax=Deinococcus hohokamensis TaxID=309883 RepID=A0ABV9ID53_9DEIO